MMLFTLSGGFSALTPLDPLGPLFRLAVTSATFGVNFRLSAAMPNQGWRFVATDSPIQKPCKPVQILAVTPNSL